jgi:DNA-binding NarL/FixJ family response regulator
MQSPDPGSGGDTGLPDSEADVATPPVDEPIEFSDRERQIAGFLVQGLTNKEIAEQLFLSTETIKSYVARILRKLGARNRVQAAVLLSHDDTIPSPAPAPSPDRVEEP